MRSGFSRRQDARRAACFAVASDSAPRTPLTDAELCALAQALDDNRVAAFGVVKLSSRSLDTPLSSGDTLVRRAAVLGRDAICAALLRAGADGSAHSCGSCTGFGACLRVAQPSFAVWLLARHASLELSDDGCSACASGCGCARRPFACAHVLCELCFWSRAVLWEEADDESGSGFACPLCAPTHSISAPAPAPGAAAASLARFRLLPAAPTSAPRPPFRALSRVQAAQQLLGSCAEQRSLELFRAAEAGRLLRLRALLAAGVDLEAAEADGRTALARAAWRGRAAVVHLLLAAGAEPGARDAAGCAPADAAAAAGHVMLAAELRRCCGAEAVDALTPPPPAEAVAAPRVTVLIPADCAGPGAGSCFVDGAFSDAFLSWLQESLFARLPLVAGDKPQCSSRASFFDSRAWVAPALTAALAGCRALPGQPCAARACARALPAMRFLHYDTAGALLPPHTDLSRRCELGGQRSTHTFVLFLTDCASGGETRLLSKAGGRAEVLAAVPPRRGRLLLFPHACPHDGAPVLCPPKLLLRGEAL